ncbi:MAG TPA: GNAT family N-acetyltransferase [Candidatus Limnocylindrales bacterium]
MQLDTAMAGLVLKELTVADADIYYRILDGNREHLSRYGDYPDEADATIAWVADHLSRPAPDRYGIWLGRRLIGRVDLVHAAPPRYGMGYWLSHDATGHGYATLACAVLLDHARDRRGATDIFAGLTHGNQRSVALLQRLGFQPIAEFDTYTRFHLRLDSAAR